MDFWASQRSSKYYSEKLAEIDCKCLEQKIHKHRNSVIRFNIFQVYNTLCAFLKFSVRTSKQLEMRNEYDRVQLIWIAATSRETLLYSCALYVCINAGRVYHSIASSRPSPFNADVLNIDHVLFFSADKPKAVETSVADIEPSMS